MKPISPWKQGSDPDHPLFNNFKTTLMNASFHHAGPVDEWGQAKSYIQQAAEIALNAEWPFWALERMFKEIAPLVEWHQFMQTYINILHTRQC